MASYLYIKTWKPLHHQKLTDNLSNCHIHYKECRVFMHKYILICPDSLFNVTRCKHIHLVSKYINSHLNHTPVELLNVPMRSLSVWNKKIFREVKVLGKYTTTVAMKKRHTEIWIIYPIRTMYTWRYLATNKKEYNSHIKSCLSQYRNII